MKDLDVVLMSSNNAYSLLIHGLLSFSDFQFVVFQDLSQQNDSNSTLMIKDFYFAVNDQNSEEPLPHIIALFSQEPKSLTDSEFKANIYKMVNDFHSEFVMINSDESTLIENSYSIMQIGGAEMSNLLEQINQNSKILYISSDSNDFIMRDKVKNFVFQKLRQLFETSKDQFQTHQVQQESIEEVFQTVSIEQLRSNSINLDTEANQFSIVIYECQGPNQFKNTELDQSILHNIDLREIIMYLTFNGMTNHQLFVNNIGQNNEELQKQIQSIANVRVTLYKEQISELREGILIQGLRLTPHPDIKNKVRRDPIEFFQIPNGGKITLRDAPTILEGYITEVFNACDHSKCKLSIGESSDPLQQKFDKLRYQKKPAFIPEQMNVRGLRLISAKYVILPHCFKQQIDYQMTDRFFQKQTDSQSYACLLVLKELCAKKYIDEFFFFNNKKTEEIQLFKSSSNSYIQRPLNIRNQQFYIYRFRGCKALPKNFYPFKPYSYDYGFILNSNIMEINKKDFISCERIYFPEEALIANNQKVKFYNQWAFYRFSGIDLDLINGISDSRYSFCHQLFSGSQTEDQLKDVYCYMVPIYKLTNNVDMDTINKTIDHLLEQNRVEGSKSDQPFKEEGNSTLRQICKIYIKINDYLRTSEFIEKHFSDSKFTILSKEQTKDLFFFNQNFSSQEQGDTQQIKTMKEVREHLYKNLPLLIESFTAPSTQNSDNYDRLEFYGDSLLSVLVLVELYLSKEENFTQNELDKLRQQRTSNDKFIKINQQQGLYEYMMTEVQNFTAESRISTMMKYACPGGFPINEFLFLLNNIKLKPEENSNLSIQQLKQQKFKEFISQPTEQYQNQSTVKVQKDKKMADVVEALTGMLMQTCGIHVTHSYLKSIGVLQIGYGDTIYQKGLTRLIQEAKIVKQPTKQGQDIIKKIFQEKQFSKIEELIDYKFKNRELLVQAFTHRTYSDQIKQDYKLDNIKIPDYNLLEFFGDSLLNFIVTNFFYRSSEQYQKDYPQQALHKLKSEITNNGFLSLIVIENKLHEFILRDESLVGDQDIKEVNTYVELINQGFSDKQSTKQIYEDEFAEKYQKNFMDPVKMLETAYSINIKRQSLKDILHKCSKIFGDVFEALIGAIFIDCGGNLELTQKHVLIILKPYLYVYGHTDTMTVHPRNLLNDKLAEQAFSKMKEFPIIITHLNEVDKINMRSTYRGRIAGVEVIVCNFDVSEKNKVVSFFNRFFGFFADLVEELNGKNDKKFNSQVKQFIKQKVQILELTNYAGQKEIIESQKQLQAFLIAYIRAYRITWIQMNPVKVQEKSPQ